jgi:signal transduction histidine kinase
MANVLFDSESADRGELRVSSVPFDFDILLGECASFYRTYAAQKRISLDVDGPLPPMRALGDPARVLQILDNIFYNAVKFTPASGRIVVGLSPSAEKGFVTATISDTGSGFSKAALKELSGDATVPPRLDPQARIGMGLKICRRLVAVQGGKLDLSSEPGKGTVVGISLPSAD